VTASHRDTAVDQSWTPGDLILIDLVNTEGDDWHFIGQTVDRGQDGSLQVRIPPQVVLPPEFELGIAFPVTICCVDGASYSQTATVSLKQVQPLTLHIQPGALLPTDG
jgi:hypothetical protein